MREKRKKPGYNVGAVDWNKHIWPLLRRAPLLSWVNIKTDGRHVGTLFYFFKYNSSIFN